MVLLVPFHNSSSGDAVSKITGLPHIKDQTVVIMPLDQLAQLAIVDGKLNVVSTVRGLAPNSGPWTLSMSVGHNRNMSKKVAFKECIYAAIRSECIDKYFTHSPPELMNLANLFSYA